MNSRQKRIAVISDFTGFGRCSIAVSLPILSALKCQCCPVPTAVLSNHTGFAQFFLDDYTEKMEAYIAQWHRLGLKFDGILTGFLGSEQQIAIVSDFIRRFRGPETTVFVDPVMGDNGKLYATYSPALTRRMGTLLAQGDVATPNLTEACILTGTPYDSIPYTTKTYLQLCRKIAAMGPGKIVLTGLPQREYVANFVYENGAYGYIRTKKVGVRRSGTGDVFASVVAGKMTRGAGLSESVRAAAVFLKQSLEYSEALGIPKEEGVCFEEFLTQLT